jgi:hypothetical protein
MHINRGVKSKIRNIRTEANTQEINVMVNIHRRVITGLDAAIKYNRGQIPIVGIEKAIEGIQHDLMNAFDYCMGHHVTISATIVMKTARRHQSNSLTYS